MDADKSLTLKSKNKTRRENTKEERKKQLREWKKRKLECRKVKCELPAAVAEGPVANVQPAKPKDHEVETNIADTTAKDEKTNASPEIHKKQFKALTSSRGALLVQMARGNAVNPSMFTAEAPLRRSTESLEQDNLQNDKQCVPCKQFKQPVCAAKDSEDSKIGIKELNPEHLEHLSENAVGSGSYGQCYRAHYCCIEVLVKVQLIPPKSVILALI